MTERSSTRGNNTKKNTNSVRVFIQHALDEVAVTQFVYFRNKSTVFCYQLTQKCHIKCLSEKEWTEKVLNRIYEQQHDIQELKKDAANDSITAEIKSKQMNLYIMYAAC